MSKADQPISTSAPASKSRRAVILGAGGIAAVAALSAAVLARHAADDADNHHAVIAEIRRLHAKHQGLITYEMSIEVRKRDPMRPAYEAAIAASEAAWNDLHGFCDHIRAQPVRSWDDIVIRAELCRLHDAEYGDLDETLSELWVRVLSIAGCVPQPEPKPEVFAGSVVEHEQRPGSWPARSPTYWTDYDIIFAGHLIGHFRDTAKAARYFDVPEAVILGWIRTDYIPSAWHAKVHAILEETGQTIAPHILGLSEQHDEALAPTRLFLEGGANV